MLQMLLFFIISFLASIVGAICGIGGGVIIKPVLDLFKELLQLQSVAAISFLSGCTVLSMSCYSVGRSMFAGERHVSLQTGTPLAIGGAIGGLIGRQLFEMIKNMSDNPNRVGAVQSVCLAIITIGTLAYTFCKDHIKSMVITNPLICASIGLVLGIASSFLGIGGGPINLVVLFFFFGMDTKTAAANSLYIILFSQIANLLTTLFTRKVPVFSWISLAFMAAGGICGGLVGRIFNKRMDNRAVDKLFIALMSVIVFISFFNTWRYMQ